MVRATSSNVAWIGACGLCTVTSTSVTWSLRRQTSAMRWARVSIRSTGSLRDGRPDLVHEGSVVDGVLQIVAAGGPAGVHAEHQVDHELLALAALELEDAVVPVDGDAAHGQAVP